MITVSTRKNKDYYHAVLVVTDGDYRKTYISKDMFVSRKTAKKQAEWWKHESIELGQIIDY
ncbi:MAG: hypothetical protein D4S01_09150 [Dehalococcoidia bacterium]|nr:MAG: hypothetical protein D4S01_09150 [Dehalococcoidia bacterium]